MSDRTKRIAEVLEKVDPAWEPPAPELVFAEDVSLVEVGLLCVLTRHLSSSQADKTLRAFRNAYVDWNDLRVSQVQEFEELVRSKNDALRLQVARDVRAYLQEVFQKNHGFDLEWLREDPNEAGKFIAQLDFLGGAGAHYLLWVAMSRAVPASPGTVRVLDRLGLMRRTSSMRKAQELLEPLVPQEERARFASRIGLVAERWCDPKRPICWECALLEDCPHGRKVYREWTVQQRRLEKQRQREEERRQREEARERKRAEAEARRREAKRLRDEERKKREDERRRRQEEKKRQSEERAKKQAKKKAAGKGSAASAGTKKKTAASGAVSKAAASKSSSSKSGSSKAGSGKKTQKTAKGTKTVRASKPAKAKPAKTKAKTKTNKKSSRGRGSGR